MTGLDLVVEILSDNFIYITFVSFSNKLLSDGCGWWGELTTGWRAVLKDVL